MAKDFIAQLKEGMKPKPDQVALERLSAAAEYGKDPSSYGHMMEVASRHGLSAEAVELLPKLRIEDLDRREQRRRALRQNVEVAEFYANNPRNAIVGYRDVEQLVRVKTQAKRLGAFYDGDDSTAGRLAATAAGVPKGAASGLGGLSRSFYGLIQWANDVDQWLTETTGIPFGTIRHTVGEENMEEWIQENLDVARDLPTALHVAMTGDDYDLAEFIMSEIGRAQYRPFLGIGTEDVTSAGVSLAPTILTGAAGLGMTGMAVVAGLQSGGATFADKVDEGSELGEATGMAVLSGAITGLLTRYIAGGTEKAAQFLRAAPNARDYLARSMTAAVGKQAGLEFIEEVLDETLQSLLVHGKGLQESIADGLKAGGIGAILGGGLSVGPARISVMRAQVEQAQTMGDLLDGLREEAQATGMAQSSPTTLAQFAEDQGAPQTARVDATALRDLMADQAMAEDIEAAGVDRAQVEKAAEAGGSVAINPSVLAIKGAQQTYDAVKPLLRKDSAAMSVQEAQEFQSSEAEAQAREESDELTKEQRAFQEQVKRIRSEIATATRLPKADQHSKEYAAVIAQGMWSMYQRNPEAYQSLGVNAGNILERVSVQFEPDVEKILREVDLTSDAIHTQGGTPEEFAAALPEPIRDEVQRGVESMRKSEDKAGRKLEPEQAQRQVEAMARMEAVRQGAVVSLDASADGPQAVGPESIREVFEGDAWQDAEVTFDDDGDAQTVRAADAVTHLSRREKAAEGLLLCMRGGS